MSAHNLDIHAYSFEEVLQLFDLDYDISVDSLKRAKKKVLMMHPDKSKLPPDYFLFYKKAFEIVLRFYENQHRTSQSIPAEKIQYDSHTDKRTQTQVSSALDKMSPADFQKKFNQLFDENMSKPQDTTKNEWFSNTNSSYHVPENVSVNTMSTIFDKVKQTQRGLVKYKGVETLYVNGGSGNRLYDEDDEDTYATSDPFSKLKFDDLRKVHKDQTVFSVSEKDLQNVPQYRSVNHIMQERGKQSLVPLDKQQSEQLLATQNKTYRDQMMQKEYQDKLRTMQYTDKNKAVLSHFLYLTNS
jgi:hypothetical protein